MKSTNFIKQSGEKTSVIFTKLALVNKRDVPKLNRTTNTFTLSSFTKDN